MLSLAALGCGGPEAELASLVCDCEHCNDWREEEVYDGLQTGADVADLYGCIEDWDVYVQCQIDEGRCEEDNANWTLQGPGSCTASLDLMMPCMTDAECAMLGGPGAKTCSVTMTCVTTACVGSNNPCDANSDCPGADQCQSQQDRFNDCINKGSDHGGPSGPF
jgi:hypothetical protein